MKTVHHHKRVICHAFPAWDGNYLKSTVELMRALAHLGHQVLYIDYAYTWFDFLKAIAGKSRAPWKRMIGLKGRVRHEAPGLFVLTLPPVLPANFIKNPWIFKIVNRLNAIVIRPVIENTRRKLGFSENAVLVNAFNPAFGLALGEWKGVQRTFYYCYDEIQAAVWANRHGSASELAFAPKCQAVIVTSSGLEKGKKHLNPNIFVVKNGVHAKLFMQPTPADKIPSFPENWKNRKIIGYLGSIDDRLDFDLLENLFNAFPDERFLFVGRVQNKEIKEKFRQFSNVWLPGAFPAEDLPPWVQAMDVCMIPFVKNRFTQNIYPLKINEYLAAGKPVVSTNFAVLDDFSSVVDVENNAFDFEKTIRRILNDPEQNSFQTINYRKDFAQKNDWMARAEIFASIIFS